MKIAGEAVYVDAAGKRHSIEGYGSLPDGDELQTLNASGEFSFGKISCGDVKISGSCEGKSLAAKNISVEGSCEVDAVNVEEKFKLSGSAEIETLCAKKIVIESRGGSIGSINCDVLKIFPQCAVVKSANAASKSEKLSRRVVVKSAKFICTAEFKLGGTDMKFLINPSRIKKILVACARRGTDCGCNSFCALR